MAMRRAKVIFNPISGTGITLRPLPELVKRLESRGFSVDVLATRRPGDAERAARELPAECSVVIAAGGGGIPVIRNEVGSLRGVEAVIDKDRASSLLAQTLRADLLMISTDVEKVALHYNTPRQRNLDTITLVEARQYVEEGHFGQGSMLPKIEAIRGRLSDGQWLQVDGGINPVTARRCRDAGADVVVAGNGIFAAPDPGQAVRDLREAVAGA